MNNSIRIVDSIVADKRVSLILESSRVEDRTYENLVETVVSDAGKEVRIHRIVESHFIKKMGYEIGYISSERMRSQHFKMYSEIIRRIESSPEFDYVSIEYYKQGLAKEAIWSQCYLCEGLLFIQGGPVCDNCPIHRMTVDCYGHDSLYRKTNRMIRCLYEQRGKSEKYPLFEQRKKLVLSQLRIIRDIFFLYEKGYKLVLPDSSGANRSFSDSIGLRSYSEIWSKAWVIQDNKEFRLYEGDQFFIGRANDEDFFMCDGEFWSFKRSEISEKDDIEKTVEFKIQSMIDQIDNALKGGRNDK